MSETSKRVESNALSANGEPVISILALLLLLLVLLLWLLLLTLERMSTRCVPANQRESVDKRRNALCPRISNVRRAECMEREKRPGREEKGTNNSIREKTRNQRRKQIYLFGLAMGNVYNRMIQQGGRRRRGRRKKRERENGRQHEVEAATVFSFARFFSSSSSLPMRSV